MHRLMYVHEVNQSYTIKENVFGIQGSVWAELIW